MDTYSSVKITHQVVVILFLLIYLIKTLLLLTNSLPALQKFSKAVKVPEMIVSFLFLLTGVYLIWEKGGANSFMVYKLIAVFLSIPLAVIGFKKLNKGLAVLSFLLLVAAYGLAEMSAKRVDKKELPAETGTDNAGQGKAVYNAYCVSCHGEDGTKGLGDAADLTASAMDKEAMKTIIIHGKGTMMPFEGVLSEEEVNAVADYIIKNIKK